VPRPLHQDHRAQRLPFVESPITRLASLLVVGALGALALGATAQPASSAGVKLSAGRSELAAGPAAALRSPGSLPRGAAAVAAKPVAPPKAHAAPGGVKARPTAARSRSAAPRPNGRYIPAGTGMWIYEWRRTNHGDPRSIVRRARGAGLSTLYLRTGSSWDGFVGGHHLQRLLGATRGTDVKVVAWDFPRLRHPVRDARRLVAAARVRTAHGLHVAAVAPDIETPHEGTFNARWRVSAYLSALRHSLPADVSIITAVPWPSRYRVSDYPYGTVAARSDVLVPMAYWYNNRPDVVTARSIGYLRRFHRPVQPVGQGYDGKLDVPGLRHHNNLRRQVPAFFRTAHQHGASAVSLWSWQAAPPVAWHALRNAHRLFPKHR
jgi:hypothetical protein